MAPLRQILVTGAIAALVSAHGEAFGKRAEAGSIMGYGMQRVAEDAGLAGLAPGTQHKGTKNVTSVPQLKDRSAELYEKRQYCDAGYGYCSELGFCCPDTDMCCGWGYCIAPEDTCCPYGACDAGEDCCGDGCIPTGADCCSDGGYCEAGNECIIDYSTSEIVCCTDVSCTAAVISGTTSYLTTSYADATTEAPGSTITDAPTYTYTEYEWTTWYMTVTWWYFSYYWYTYEETSSTVTYDQIYETTTYTTTATDDYDASSWYSSMSESLTFSAPSDAQTSLASLLGETPSETATATVADSFGTTSSEPRSTSASTSRTSRTSTNSSATSGAASSTSSVEAAPGGSGSAGPVMVQSVLISLAAVCGVLMVWL